MSTGGMLTVVALALALVIGGLFRLVGVLDAAELRLRRLVAELRATRKELNTAGDLAAAVERDATEGRAALDHLENLKRARQGRQRRLSSG
jgi:hypothetical protein